MARDDVKRVLIAGVIAFAAGVVVVVLLLPMGCGPPDGGPLPGAERDTCPRSPSRVGVIGPNESTGLLVAGAVSLLTVAVVGGISWRLYGRPQAEG